MTHNSGHPRRWYLTSVVWTACVFLLLAFFVMKNYRVHEHKAETFYKEKEARRGKIRKAREGKEAYSITQERLGVTRSCYLEDLEGLRREFFLKAKAAHISSSVTEKQSVVKELFFEPKGWLQEELFFEISSTGEKVIRKDETWVTASVPHKAIPSRLYRDVMPMQQIRFFDAVTAEWTHSTNELVAHKALFSIIKAPGHELPSQLDTGKTLSRGTAEAIIFSFDKKGRQIIKSEGVKLHLGESQ